MHKSPAIDLLRACVPHVVLGAALDPSNEIKFDPSRYGRQLPEHAQLTYWNMWANAHGMDRYAKLFQRLAKRPEFSAFNEENDGPVLRLYAPIQKGAKLARYSPLEAHVRNILHDSGKYQLKPGGYYDNVVVDTKNGREVALIGVLRDLARRDHESAVRRAKIDEVLKLISQATFTTPGAEGEGRGKVNKRYTDMQIELRVELSGVPAPGSMLLVSNGVKTMAFSFAYLDRNADTRKLTAKSVVISPSSLENMQRLGSLVKKAFPEVSVTVDGNSDKATLLVTIDVDTGTDKFPRYQAKYVVRPMTEVVDTPQGPQTRNVNVRVPNPTPENPQGMRALKRGVVVIGVGGTVVDNKPSKDKEGSSGPRRRRIEDVRKDLAYTTLDKLIDRIAADPARDFSADTKGTGLMVVISRDPVDIATMSTNRKWNSCMALEYGPYDPETGKHKTQTPGGFSVYVPNAVRYGGLVVYCTDSKDVTVDRPRSRLSLVPFVNVKDKRDIVLMPSTANYGSPPAGFMDLVYHFLDVVNTGNKGGMYKAPPFGFYLKDLDSTNNPTLRAPAFGQDEDPHQVMARWGIPKNKYSVRKDGLINVNGDVTVPIKEFVSDGLRGRVEETVASKLPVKFGRVTGDFICSADTSTYDPTWYSPFADEAKTTAKNDWSRTKSFSDFPLGSLVGFPEYVGGDCRISGLRVKTLTGCPQEIGGHFIAQGLKAITALVGGPRKVGGNYDVSFSTIETTKGIEGCEIGQSLVLSHSKITALDGKPGSVGKDVDVSCTDLLTTLGLPDRVEGNLFMRNLPKLMALRGMPKYIGDNLSITNATRLKSLKGIENTEIMQDFWFNDGVMRSIDAYPKYVGDCMNMRGHYLPRDTQKPPTVKNRLLLGHKVDGSDYVQKHDADGNDADFKIDGLDLDFDFDVDGFGDDLVT